MKKPGIFLDIVDMVVPIKSREPFRPHLRPGDVVSADTGLVTGDVPLLARHIIDQLEYEAFRGRNDGNVPTGWIRSGETALVIAVVDEYAYLYGPRGRGWVDRQVLVAVRDISSPGKGATVDEWRKNLSGAA
jgi:hypothetical protein